METALALTEKEPVKVLIVDDEEPVIKLLERLLEREGYSCRSAANVKAARKFLEKENFDLALCDVNMPGESGLELARFILGRKENTAVLMVTGVDDLEVGKSILELGAYGYVIKPFNPGELLLNIHNVLRRRNLEIENREYREKLEKIVSRRTAELRATLNKLRRTMQGIVQSTALVVEARDPYTAGHQKKVANLACAIAGKLGLSEDRIEGIRMAALIHDVGKISVPVEILCKPAGFRKMNFL
jgi:putative two-component system response regulator